MSQVSRYDKESGKGYKSVRVCPQNSDASWDVKKAQYQNTNDQNTNDHNTN